MLVYKLGRIHLVRKLADGAKYLGRRITFLVLESYGTSVVLAKIRISMVGSVGCCGSCQNLGHPKIRYTSVNKGDGSPEIT